MIALDNGCPWLSIGDSNIILSTNEKRGGNAKGKRCSYFGDFMDLTNLHDLGFRESFYTWHRRDVFERLDRAIKNDK